MTAALAWLARAATLGGRAREAVDEDTEGGIVAGAIGPEVKYA